MARETRIADQKYAVVFSSILMFIRVRTFLLRYVHGRVGTDHLPPNIMMGKSASLVRIEVEGETSAEKSEMIADMGRKLAMHVVRTHRAYFFSNIFFVDIF